jgi:hypothetical protein
VTSFQVGKTEVSEETLRELLAERDIRNQIHNYSRAQDRHDTELFLSVCHPDCYIDYGPGGPQGSAADTIQRFNADHSGFAGHNHHVSNITIKVKGRRAISESSVNAVLRTHEDDHGVVYDWHYRGRYLDRWSQRDGRWALDRRLLLSELHWKQLVVDGRLYSHGGPTRDRADPLYAALAELDEAAR